MGLSTCIVIILSTTVWYSLSFKFCQPGELTVYEGNQTKYFKCIKGMNILKSCPQGLVFNPQLSECVVDEVLRRRKLAKLKKTKTKFFASTYLKLTTDNPNKSNKRTEKKGHKNGKARSQMRMWHLTPLVSTTRNDVYIATQQKSEAPNEDTAFTKFHKNNLFAIQVSEQPETVPNTNFVDEKSKTKPPKPLQKVSQEEYHDESWNLTQKPESKQETNVNVTKPNVRTTKPNLEFIKKQKLHSTPEPLISKNYKQTSKLKWKPRLKSTTTKQIPKIVLNETNRIKEGVERNLQTFPPVYMAPKSDYESDTITIGVEKTTVTNFLELYMEPITKAFYNLGLYPDMDAIVRTSGSKEINPTPISPMYQTELEEKEMAIY